MTCINALEKSRGRGFDARPRHYLDMIMPYKVVIIKLSYGVYCMADNPKTVKDVLYGIDKKIKAALRRLEKAENITEHNKELILEFKNHTMAKGLSKHRVLLLQNRLVCLHLLLLNFYTFHLGMRFFRQQAVHLRLKVDQTIV